MDQPSTPAPDDAAPATPPNTRSPLRSLPGLIRELGLAKHALPGNGQVAQDIVRNVQAHLATLQLTLEDIANETALIQIEADANGLHDEADQIRALGRRVRNLVEPAPGVDFVPAAYDRVIDLTGGAL